MIGVFLSSGLYSVTLWVSLIVFVSALRRLFRREKPGGSPGSLLPRVLTRRSVLALVAGATLLNVLDGVYKGYVSPRDLMQDIVSAQQYLGGEPLYPDHMNDLMRTALEKEPPHSLLAWSPALRQKELDSLENTLGQHWVQAHPPLMTLCVAPLVATVGIAGTYFTAVLVSLASLTLTLWCLGRGLGLKLTRRHALLLILVVLGWDNVVILLRSGQPSVLLGALLALGWFLLRRERPVLAGAAIGLAAALKAFPALLLFYLLLRHRRAFVSGVATLALLVLFTGSVAGWDAYRDHLATARGVVAEYAAYPNNLSLLAFLARFEGPPGRDHPLTPLLFYGMGFVIVAAVGLFVWRNPRRGDARHDFLDLEYALLMTVMVLLSPVAWDHYVPLVLLPLVVLGRHVLAAPGRRPGAVALFAGMAALLAVPDKTYLWVFDLVPAGAGQTLARVLLMPLRTYILAIICFWLVRLAVRLPGRAPAPAVIAEEPARAPVPAFGHALLRHRPALCLGGVLLTAFAAHLAVAQPAEPSFNNDETRHVMTGVYFRDLLLDRPAEGLRAYTERYYLQYPALGLLVWPPFFYLVEGVAMLALGTSFTAARLVVGAFAALAIVYLFRLARRTHGLKTATLAALLFALSPLVFQFAHQVMLEVPTLALALIAVFYGVRYLDEGRGRDLSLCCLATALTALTRFDGIFLAPFFLILLAGRRRLGLLRRPGVLLRVAAAVLVVAPVYALTALEMGGAHLKAVRDGTDPTTSTGFLAWQNLVYYPACVPQQVGWFVALAALLGLAAALRRRAASWPYLALTGATYLTFTPMAELAPRHAIYWVPALAVFAADGLRLAAGLRPRLRLRPVLGGAAVACTAWLALAAPVYSVRGYEAAARYTLEEGGGETFCLFDGLLNGNFIYQMRRLDPARATWVLRGDKILYGMLSEPHGGYAEWVHSDEDVLAVIDRYGPELIVVEEPQLYFRLPAAERLRDVLRRRTDRFVREAVFPLETNHPSLKGGELHVYRNLAPKGARAECVEVKMLSLGRSLQVTRPN